MTKRPALSRYYDLLLENLFGEIASQPVVFRLIGQPLALLIPKRTMKH